MIDLDRLSLVSVVLQTAEIEHTLENTGGGVFVLYVPLPNDHHIGITVTDACMPWTQLDAPVLLLVCYDSSDEGDEGTTMIDGASAPLAVACLLQALGRTFFTIPS
jgi:hypothetical protein